MIDRRKVIKAGVAGMAVLWTGAARSQGKEIVLNMLRPWPLQSNDCAGYREFMSIVKAMLESGVTPDFVVVDGAEGGTGAAVCQRATPVVISSAVKLPKGFTGCASRPEMAT